MSVPESTRIELFRLARSARLQSYSPYSKFRVGACLLLSDGSFVSGCNVENCSYGLCICAERTAAVKAVSEGKPRDFVAVAVVTYACCFCGRRLTLFLQ